MWINRERYDSMLQKAAAYDELHRRFVQTLKDNEILRTENALLKDRCDREQQRADSALQTMVAHKTGVAVPMPQVAPSNEDVDPHAEDPIVVEELRERIRKGDPLKVLLEEHEATS